MRAQVLTAFGGPENFVLQDLATPDIKPGTVLVRINAASVNPLDIKIREGLPVGPPMPAILGCDMAGVVEAVGPGVIDFKPNDQVWGLVGGVGQLAGTLADYIVADARLLALKPTSLALRDAAALPLVSITALDAWQRVQLTSHDHVLVHGGVGGVGHVAVQIAKAMGARVSATVDAPDAAVLARSLGADETINFREETVDSYVARLTAGKGFDVVFDTIGGTNLVNSFAAAATHGRVVTTNGRITLDLGPLHAKALSLSVVFVMLPLLTGHGREGHGRMLREIAGLVDAGHVKPLIDPTRFTLAGVPDAHRLLESGKARGKIVIDIS